MSTSPVQQHHRRMPMHPDHHRSFRAKDFRPNIIPIKSIATRFDITKRAVGKAHIYQGVVYISNCGKIIANKYGSLRRHSLNFTVHEPAGEVKVVDGHVENQAATFSRIHIIARRAEWIATE